MNRANILLASALELQASDRAGTRPGGLFGDEQAADLSRYRGTLQGRRAGRRATGRGYSLAASYLLPPLSSRADEATTLLPGSDCIMQTCDRPDQLAALVAAAEPCDRLHVNVPGVEANLTATQSSSATQSAASEIWWPPGC